MKTVADRLMLPDPMSSNVRRELALYGDRRPGPAMSNWRPISVASSASGQPMATGGLGGEQFEEPRQRLSLSQTEHDLPSPRSSRRMFGRRMRIPTQSGH